MSIEPEAEIQLRVGDQVLWQGGRLKGPLKVVAINRARVLQVWNPTTRKSAWVDRAQLTPLIGGAPLETVKPSDKEFFAEKERRRRSIARWKARRKT